MGHETPHKQIKKPDSRGRWWLQTVHPEHEISSAETELRADLGKGQPPPRQ